MDADESAAAGDRWRRRLPKARRRFVANVTGGGGSRYALTAGDRVRIDVLVAVVGYLDRLARVGCWDAQCDRLSDQLGRYGLGRN